MTNIALVAFTGLSLESLLPADNKGDNHGDVEITQAVDGKYDALRDQLLIQALIDQVCMGLYVCSLPSMFSLKIISWYSTRSLDLFHMISSK